MKKFLILFLFTFIILATGSLSAQNAVTKKTIAGSWIGKLSADGMELRVVFNIKLIEPDSLTATLDSPDQGAKDIPCEKVTFADKILVVTSPIIKGEYLGSITGDSISGTWTQNGGSLPLNLKRQTLQK